MKGHFRDTSPLLAPMGSKVTALRKGTTRVRYALGPIFLPVAPIHPNSPSAIVSSAQRLHSEKPDAKDVQDQGGKLTGLCDLEMLDQASLFVFGTGTTPQGRNAPI